MDGKSRNDVREWIERSIKELVESPQNSLQTGNDEKAWDEPLIGFSRGDDPLYAQIKSMIGDFHWLPEEIFNSRQSCTIRVGCSPYFYSSYAQTLC